MNLYRVKVVYETVVSAKDEIAALVHAHYIVRYEADEDPQSVAAFAIKALSDLPEGWNAQCRPWGERDPQDRTIGEMLNQISL